MNDLNYYVNLSLTNLAELPVHAQIVNNRSQSVINTPGDYECSIVRFQVDVSSLPLFYPSPSFGVCLSYNGVDFPAPVPYSPYQSTYGIFSYAEWCENINEAFVIAFNALNAAFPGRCTDSPRVYVDYTTQLLKFYCQVQYKEDFLPAPVTVWTNINLQRQINLPFRSYNPGAANFKEFSLLLNNGGITLPTFGLRIGQPDAVNKMLGEVVEFTAEYSNLTSWFSLNKLVFKTSQIAIVPEVVPQRSQIVGDQNSGDNTSNIFTDFLLDKSSPTQRRGVYLYVPTSEYRMISLVPGVGPLGVFDISAFWQDDLGYERPLTLLKGGSMSLKLLFRPRTR